MPANSYYINHVIMHHKGANKWNVDLSSVVKYNRMSVFHFVFYWLRHYTPLTFPADMVYVCVMYRKWLSGFLYFVTVCVWYGIIAVGLRTQYSVFVLWTGFFGACGGWMQHMFVHQWYSFDIVNSPANSRGFNQGFHNTHHTLGHLHWTELPQGFWELLKQYEEDDVLIMHTLDNVEILYLVLTQKLDQLAQYMVTTKATATSCQECVSILRAHLMPDK